ncbi:MAG: MarC family protein [candidate division WOR-3 bacterium]|jgi:multiple antibiotic resistance protein|nr:MarC family protein [candidate division WOR-3 bacterium]MCR4424033.1 MarC family protein [candidate division WOR-3 bacterium]MDH7519548.1 MarC family protein [bacterium]
MLYSLLQLIILFFVIFDPLLSFVVFFGATADMSPEEKRKTALLAVIVAFSISLLCLIFGASILRLFNTNIQDFKIAGGIILAILGIKMSLGQSDSEKVMGTKRSAKAIASIIATPLLTGPASITAIIISVHDYGRLLTAIAVLLVLIITLILFLQAPRITRFTGETALQVVSTLMGLITLSWGIMFIKQGFGS